MIALQLRPKCGRGGDVGRSYLLRTMPLAEASVTPE